jgi:TetR/AcrR family transcriptional regulator
MAFDLSPGGNHDGYAIFGAMPDISVRGFLMKANRRLGVEGAENRALLVSAAEELLREEGAVAITARRVTGRAKLKTQLLYYYFQTMDELVLAVAERAHAKRIARLKLAEAAPRPLHAIFAMIADPDNAIVAAELVSMAAHRDAVRDRLNRMAGEFRTMQVSAVNRIFDARSIDRGQWSAEGLTMIMVSVSRTVACEEALGFNVTHAAGLDMVRQMLVQIEPL